ncbi:retrovirus-related pol polyprotein from transposon TNT 1-94, partial [Tanacetum coccineum]
MPNSPKTSEKLVVVTPMNKDKRVRFVEPVTSSSNIPKQTDSLKTKDANKPLLTSTGVKPTTTASGSKPSGNTKNNRITRPPSSNENIKVDNHSRKVKSSLNKMNYVSEPISNALVKNFMRNAKFESICAICNKCLFDAYHDMCIIDYVNDVNVPSKSKSKRNKMRKVWKPTGKVFSEIGYSWKHIGRTFTIVENKCPLTRITSTKVVPTKEISTKSVATPIQGILVYSRRPKATRSVGSTVSDVLSSSLNGCRTDNGTEFVNQTLRDYYEEVRISYQTSVAPTPQQNGIVERQNRTLVEATRTMLIFSKDMTRAKHSFFNSVCPTNKERLGNIISTNFDEYLNPPPYVDPQVPPVIAPESGVSTVIPLSFEEADHDIEVAHMDNNPFVDFPIPKPSSKESSTQ